MSQDATTETDPFRLGRRYLREIAPDGTVAIREVPLTPEDLLYPEEGDEPVHRDPHSRDCVYLKGAFRIALRDRANIHVFEDHRINFNLRGVRPLGPDIAVIAGIPGWDGSLGTLDLKSMGQPLLVAEVTSPDTRGNDVGIKRTFYQRARVPIYIIVDHHDPAAVELIVYRLGKKRYQRVEADRKGRVSLEEYQFSLSVEDNEVWVYLDSGRIEEMPELHARLQQSDERYEHLQAQLAEEVDLRHEADEGRRQADEGRRQADEGRRQVDEALRQADEARRQADEGRRLADQARRLADERANAEAEARRRADERANAEAEARRVADEQAVTDAEARKQLSEANEALQRRLRELEERLAS